MIVEDGKEIKEIVTSPTANIVRHHPCRFLSRPVPAEVAEAASRRRLLMDVVRSRSDASYFQRFMEPRMNEIHTI